MRFERVTSTQHSRYGEALALYGSSFPFHEQRQARSQAEILGNEAYAFNLIYDGGAFVGLLLCWETKTFIYVEHFCILPSMRNKKYGQKALELLERKGKTVILEIDPPVDALSLRRRAFYERAGFVENPYAHTHPAYHANYPGHALVVMSCPAPLTEAAYQEFFTYLKTVVMGGV